MECAKEPDAITAKSLPQVGICAWACQPHREGKLGRQPWLGAGEKGFVPLPLPLLIAGLLDGTGKVGNESRENSGFSIYT